METIPHDLKKALTANLKAKKQWDDLTPISRRDFISWIISAKQDETRARRVKVACSKLVSGQRRPCCYAVVPMNLYKELAKNAKAKAAWKALTADQKRDFNDWVVMAKDKVDENARVQKSVMLIAAGKLKP